MAIIKPFKAIRPREELADKVAALPYDVMNSQEAKIIAKDNPYSFLHIDKSEIDLEDGIDEYDEKVYLKAKENLEGFKSEKILIKEEKECIYIYKQVMNNRAQVGIVACLSVDDSLNGVIKKHEYTKPDKEKDRTNHIRYCNANTGTILVTYKSKQSINELIYKYIEENKPLYDFTTEDNITHTIWKIENEDNINYLIEEFDKIPHLYIADGHHRSASAENIAKEMRKKNPDYTGEEEFNYYLAMIAPDEELMILDYNRVVKDLNGMEEEVFIEKVKEKFEVNEVVKSDYKPEAKGKIGMYLNNKWYELKVDENKRDKEDMVKSLDISILQDNLISPILGIANPKADKRIDFVGGIRGLSELEKRVNEDMKVAFAMYPTSIDELISVADRNQIMPAKSTWFEPKVRCGLFLHELDL
ncbi:MAG: DUF1015 domain-containing protein [Peptostreptococcaceae bacterium]